jgi:hypothetical protein
VKPNRLKMCGAGADTLKRGEGEGMDGVREEQEEGRGWEVKGKREGSVR